MATGRKNSKEEQILIRSLNTQTDLLNDIVLFTDFMRDHIKAKEEDSLKPITDPVSQIKETSQKEVDLLKDSGNLLKTITDLEPEKFRKNLTAVREVIPFISDLVKGMNVDGKTLDDKLKVADIISKLSSGISGLANNIFTSAVKLRVARPMISWITGSLNKLVQGFSYKNSVDEAKNAAQSIDIISKSILDLSWKVTLAAPLLLVAAPALVIFKGFLMLAQWTFKNIKPDEIATGAISLGKMGLGFVAFSGGLALSAFILKGIVSEVGSGDFTSIGSLGILFGSLALTLLLFKTLSNDSGMLAKGALGVALISLSLPVFAMSISVSSTLISANPLAVVGSLLTLSGFALLYNYMGKSVGNIAYGSLAAFAIGVSLLILSAGLVPLIKTFAENPVASLVSIIGLPVGLIALGAAYAALGLGIELIVPGAIAAAAIGRSLQLVGKGLQAIFNIPVVTEEKAKGMYMGIRAMIKGFSSASVVDIAKISFAIPAIIGMSLALPGIASGISKWDAVSGSWTPENAKTLEYTIGSLSKAFALAGSTEGQTRVFGFPIGKNDVERGIASTMKMGNNLHVLADGIFAWSSKGKIGKDIQGEIPTIVGNIESVLNAIPFVFANIGQRERGQTPGYRSLLGLLVGNDFSHGDVEAGIRSTMKISDNLITLADGIVAWSSKGKIGKDIQGEIPTIVGNIESVLNTIPFIFANIGQRDRGQTPGYRSLWGTIFGSDWSKGDVEAGIASTMRLGSNLKSLADGIFAWSSKGKKGKDIQGEMPTIVGNIEGVLKAIPQAFATIGKQNKETEGWWSDGDIEAGIALVKDLSPILQSVAAVVNSFQGKNATVTGMDIGYGIRNIFAGINQAALISKDGSSIKSVTTSLNQVSNGLNNVQKYTRLAYAEINRLVGVTKPFENFLKLFVEFTRQLTEQNKMFATLKVGNVTEYSKLIEKLTEFGKVDFNSFKENSGYILGDKIDKNQPAPRQNIVTDFANRTQRQKQQIAASVTGKTPNTKQGFQAPKTANDVLIEHLETMNGLLATLVSATTGNKIDSEQLASLIAQKIAAVTLNIVDKTKAYR